MGVLLSDPEPGPLSDLDPEPSQRTAPAPAHQGRLQLGILPSESEFVKKILHEEKKNIIYLS